MSWINKPLIVECLRELSDRSLQLRLWLSTGQGDVSSFTEAVEQLFTDSALEEELQKHTTGLGGSAENALIDLEKALARVDRKLPPARLIDSAEMDVVRRLASAALAAIDGQT
jgi:hypothetical protein